MGSENKGMPDRKGYEAIPSIIWNKLQGIRRKNKWLKSYPSKVKKLCPYFAFYA
jgi:hypothetical protein